MRTKVSEAKGQGFICGVLNTVACHERSCALARANRAFCTDKKHPYRKRGYG